MNNPTGIMQIYGAYAHHDSIQIIGDRTALTNLVAAIKEALDHGVAEANVWAADGEGYSVQVVQVDTGLNNPVWGMLPAHYQAEWIPKTCRVLPEVFYMQKNREGER